MQRQERPKESSLKSLLEAGDDDDDYVDVAAIKYTFAIKLPRRQMGQYQNYTLPSISGLEEIQQPELELDPELAELQDYVQNTEHVEETVETLELKIKPFVHPQFPSTDPKHDKPLKFRVKDVS